MSRFTQGLVLAAIILSCGFIFSLGSSATSGAREEARSEQQSAESVPPHKPYRVVYYAQDRHAPW